MLNRRSGKIYFVMIQVVGPRRLTIVYLFRLRKQATTSSRIACYIWGRAGIHWPVSLV